MVSSYTTEELVQQKKTQESSGAKISAADLDPKELPSDYNYPAQVLLPDENSAIPITNRQNFFKKDDRHMLRFITEVELGVINIEDKGFRWSRIKCETQSSIGAFGIYLVP